MKCGCCCPVGGGSLGFALEEWKATAECGKVPLRFVSHCCLVLLPRLLLEVARPSHGATVMNHEISAACVAGWNWTTIAAPQLKDSTFQNYEKSKSVFFFSFLEVVRSIFGGKNCFSSSLKEAAVHNFFPLRSGFCFYHLNYTRNLTRK